MCCHFSGKEKTTGDKVKNNWTCDPTTTWLEVWQFRYPTFVQAKYHWELPKPHLTKTHTKLHPGFAPHNFGHTSPRPAKTFVDKPPGLFQNILLIFGDSLRTFEGVTQKKTP